MLIVLFNVRVIIRIDVIYFYSYKKFTRGKDISRYSEKDLANIFGKKVDDIKTEENKTVSNVESDPPKATEDNEKYVYYYMFINNTLIINTDLLISEKIFLSE